MAWSITEVARMSGVTSRTLRHYDRVGLLPPAYTAANGYRHYGEKELLRLQQILLLRELGLGLREIADVLDRQIDPAEALRAHHRRLLAERDRLDRLARTVRRTLAGLDEGGTGLDLHGTPEEERGERGERGHAEREQHDGSAEEDGMTAINRPEDLFEGFDTERYGDEARRKWPEEWAQSRRNTEALGDEDTARMKEEATAQMVRMAEFMAAGTPVDDPAVQREIDAHYEGMCRLWTPNRDAYKALARTFVDDEQWRTTYERVAEGLAAYQRDAMIVYADARLS